MHVLDSGTMLWSQPKCTGALPPGLQSHVCVLTGERLLVIGGCTMGLDGKGHTYCHFNHEMFVLHAQSMLWERLRNRGENLSARAHTAVALVENFLVLFGGWSGKCETLQEMITLDLNGFDSWRVFQVPGQTPAGVYGHTATLIGTNVIIFGGWDGISPMNAVHVLDTSLL